MRSLTPLLLGLAIVVVAGTLAAIPGQTGTTQTPMPAVDSSQTYSLADITKHGDSKSCWSAINGGVYDLTDWIDKHPGGPSRILSICGKDGSAPFNAQHGGAQLQQQILTGYKIGTLAN